MELRHLRYFVAVAEELSFTRAADRLHIGQPPLSQQVQALEEEIGAILFDRSRRSIRLTEAGRIFLEDAYRVLAMAASAAETARRVEKGEVGQLKIGFIKSTAFTPIFPKIINTYRTRYPNVKLVMQEMSTMRQLAALEDYSLDLAFIRPMDTDIPSHLVMTTLQNHRLSVLMPDHHRLADVDPLSIDDLRNEDFVMFPRDEGTTLNLAIYRLCAEAGFTPRVTMEAREVATITGLVAARCGIAILPDLFQSLGIKGVLFRPIDTPAMVTQLALASRAAESGTIPQAFFDIARELVAQQDSAKPVSA
ncbi:LysR family transcriptional regulator|uniref:LysR substrate-binding domain-containing protein n=1 Tax=Noviherbaspirillum sp. L7-7A TaxID=2850560 RepID=UPI001C2C978E|nr:LysR substrate-binding domain-containing protein [Noviherbaspirillum sp. L7-7A]MBV0878945.1 LysR family transcriptional regulator [Noviherbaspirillum sp. L7-7A]